ncbi:CpaD family pilus assembly protein [Roseibium sp.]|uniref:CpaD family pilus assembly protein n=1 Tax=Roseibium sp. TaxID=1936156 RepID=UPI003A974643
MMSFDHDTLFQRLLKVGLCISAAAIVAGCKTTTDESQMGYMASNDYRLRHPIVLTEQPEVLDLPVGAATRNLNSNIADSVTYFAQQARTNGNGSVDIQVPAGAANEAAVHAVVPAIRSALSRGGVAANRIATRTYAVDDPGADAPIRLSYERVMASTGKCGEWPENIGGKANANTDYQNFGCASQANLAAMVANPADLIAPRAPTAGDQMRRAVVYEKYRAGAVTASEYKEGEGAKVSE